ncbi:hypothetical protein JCGZ_18410 [Jatropha curcas]|uniref:E3 ubiquitin-protein ligase RMA n=1 Tax=Jatropha curcas TaxID=180498 RepID=A0A067KC65_JATCU|nr:hypothetical protein JCGZ_18410 [Jatropha curcas]
MGEEISNIMNLDLNLGPGPQAGSESITSEAVNLDNFIAEPIDRISESFMIRGQSLTLGQFQIPPETHDLSVELNQLIRSSGDVSTSLAAAEERTNELQKTCDINSRFLEDEVSVKKSDVDEGSGNDGSFFDCNICFELATDPVVTSCGHLFCWPCLFQRLHVHSDAKECPVCKEEVTIKNVTPIYGRGNNTRKPKENSSLQVPLRPPAKRVESFRQAIYRNPFSFPLEEIIRHLGNRFNLTRDLNLTQDSNGSPEMEDRTNPFRSTVAELEGMQTEQSTILPVGDLVDLTQSGTSSAGAMRARRIHSLLLRRSQSPAQRPSTHTSLSSALSSSERFLEAFLRNHSIGRNQEQSQPVDDRDSFSSIAAVINSDSQMDTAVEIDSMGSLSASSSRRRNDALRVYDVDNGESRAPRRRRLN